MIKSSFRISFRYLLLALRLWPDLHALFKLPLTARIAPLQEDGPTPGPSCWEVPSFLSGVVNSSSAWKLWQKSRFLMLQRGKLHYLGAETVIVFDMLLKLCLTCLKRLFVSAPSPLTLCCGSDVSVTVHCAGKQCSCCSVTSMHYARVQWSSVRVKLSGSSAAQRWWNRVQLFTSQACRASGLQIITVQPREKWPLTIFRLDCIKQPEVTRDVLLATPSCVADRIYYSFSSFQGRYCGNPPKTESDRLQSRSSASLCRLTALSWLTGNTVSVRNGDRNPEPVPNYTVCTHHQSVNDDDDVFAAFKKRLVTLWAFVHLSWIHAGDAVMSQQTFLNMLK